MKPPKADQLKLNALVLALREMQQGPPDTQLSFEDKLGLLVDYEWTERENRKIARRTKEARNSVLAAPEELICDSARGLDRATARDLTSCQWVRSHHNLVVLGPTGVGKSFLASSLAQAAIRQGFRALFVRIPRLLEQLAIARASADYSATLARLAKIDVLILDDFLLAPMTDIERRDLLEVLEDRYGKSSTVITSQLPTKSWHEMLGDPTIADAICDRLVHNAHLVTLRGSSIRRQKGLKPQLDPQPAT
ncbi:MAG TPA: IS21-like element helper ATPase IstB [Polyangiaceae bacterium]|jgi:DNA replication protein DnaC|nr:IS21-like element helper ATPase IstB [Polyangiaceae bacterium]